MHGGVSGHHVADYKDLMFSRRFGHARLRASGSRRPCLPGGVLAGFRFPDVGGRVYDPHNLEARQSEQTIFIRRASASHQ